LRRSKLARNWRGGCWSVEVTNEGKGWHLHAHLLIDAPFIPADELAAKWAQLLGQDVAIVKVQAVRGEKYLNEVTKYAVKGNDMARWNAQHVGEFVRAFSKQRTHGAFGTLYKMSLEWKRILAQLREDARQCECGCREVKIIAFDVWELEGATTIPPPVADCPSAHPEFRLN
jgi:hypothetical protein